MKLTYFQVEPHLARECASIYVVSGDELLLKQDIITLIRKRAKAAGMATRMHLSREESVSEELYTTLNSKSLLAETRLIELDFRDNLPNKISANVLTEYAENIDPNIVLLIDINKIDDKIARSNWYKAMEKNGVVIAIWPIARDQLPKWLIERAAKYKLNLQKDAANLLADYVEGNLIAAAQMIEKIFLLQSSAIIDRNLVQSILTDESQFTVFDLTDNLIAGDSARCLHILENLKQTGTEPIFILWSILRELRILATLAEQVATGENLESLFKKQRIFARKQIAMRRFLQHGRALDCWQLVSASREIDKAIKGVIPGGPWPLLQLFCLRFANLSPR